MARALRHPRHERSSRPRVHGGPSLGLERRLHLQPVELGRRRRGVGRLVRKPAGRRPRRSVAARSRDAARWRRRRASSGRRRDTSRGRGRRRRRRALRRRRRDLSRFTRYVQRSDVRAGMRVHRRQRPPGRGLLLRGCEQTRARPDVHHADVRLNLLRGLVHQSGCGQLRAAGGAGRERRGCWSALRGRRWRLPGLAGHVPGRELRSRLRVRGRRKRSGDVPLHRAEKPRWRVHRADVRGYLLRARLHVCEPRVGNVHLPVRASLCV